MSHWRGDLGWLLARKLVLHLFGRFLYCYSGLENMVKVEGTRSSGRRMFSFLVTIFGLVDGLTFTLDLLF
jgi:hypothetical protein